jgi:hypothetical protein
MLKFPGLGAICHSFDCWLRVAFVHATPTPGWNPFFILLPSLIYISYTTFFPTQLFSPVSFYHFGVPFHVSSTAAAAAAEKEEKNCSLYVHAVKIYRQPVWSRETHLYPLQKMIIIFPPCCFNVPQFVSFFSMLLYFVLPQFWGSKKGCLSLPDLSNLCDGKSGFGKFEQSTIYNSRGKKVKPKGMKKFSN